MNPNSRSADITARRCASSVRQVMFTPSTLICPQRASGRRCLRHSGAGTVTAIPAGSDCDRTFCSCVGLASSMVGGSAVMMCAQLRSGRCRYAHTQTSHRTRLERFVQVS